ncbi:MAG: rod-binding protein [Thermodesulfobacteriota bacterium]|nr:rod-binding protein [Thermodesulfobacteriota bacterium]
MIRDITTLPDISWQYAHLLNKTEYLAENVNKETKSERLQELCNEFESIFIYSLLKTMRNTIPQSSILPDDKSKQLYTAMLDQQFAKMAALKGEMGISKLFVNQFTTE